MNRVALIIGVCCLMHLVGCGGGGGVDKLPTTIQGKVVSNATTQAPVAGAVVIVAGIKKTTGSDGVFSVDYASSAATGTKLTVWLTASKDQFNTNDTQIDVTAGKVNPLLNILLSAADATTGTVTGYVKSDSGQPLSGASVAFDPVRSRMRGGRQTEGRQTGHTADDGFFQISGILSGNEQVTVVKEGFLTSSSSQLVLSGQNSTPLSLSLTPGQAKVTVSGVVLDLDTQTAIDGVTVTIAGIAGTSQNGGKFSIDNILVGTQTVTAVKQGYDNYSTSITISGATSITVTMAKSVAQPPSLPYTLLGKVSWQGATDFSGVTVSAIDANSAVADFFTTKSDGQYGLWVGPGTYTVQAVKSGFITSTKSVTVLTGGVVSDVDFTLTPG